MSSPDSKLERWFTELCGRPRLVVGLWTLILLPVAAGLAFFQLDASSESLVLQDDPDLRYYDDSRVTFGTDSALVVVAVPTAGVFERGTLEKIEALCQELESLPGVSSVLSVTRAPLFLNPPVGLFRLADGYRTIAADDVDLELAAAEMLANPLYRDALISADARTTAIQIDLAEATRLLALEQERYQLRDRARQGISDQSTARRLRDLDRQVRNETLRLADDRRLLVADLRELLARQDGFRTLEVGGLPMITVDLVRYIERDLLLFGGVSLLFVVLAVWLLFRSLAWTLAISINCIVAVFGLLGVLGWLDWRLTVVTSNLPSLLFILTLAMSVHVAVRHREESQRLSRTSAAAVPSALAHVSVPTAFTVMTTMVGFGSLYFSNLKPVMDFALMMGIGLSLAFCLCLSLLPCLFLLLRRFDRGPPALNAEPYVRVANFSLRRRRAVSAAALVLVLASAVGISRLGVENSFVDYFHADSTIHRSLTLIDRELGGTTPLEVVLQGPEPDAWLDTHRLQRLRSLHAWLEQQPEFGQVASLDSLIAVLEQIIASDPNPALRAATLNRFALATLRSRVPEELASSVLKPYVSSDFSQTRLTARVRESYDGLDREELAHRVRTRLEESPVVAASDQRLTGMFVLYNNMLDSLLSSQITTVAAVFAAVAGMFWMLLRSLTLAAIALIPNLLPVVLVLGVLGWAQIPLDMMTIMVAAIALGISVDDTVHYLYRFRKERATGSLEVAIRTAHATVGRAMLATTVAVSFGFASLAISNFRPTMYFGLLTGLAMLTALLADVILLPGLLRLREQMLRIVPEASARLEVERPGRHRSSC